MTSVLIHFGRLFDYLQARWESPRTHRVIGSIITLSFIFALGIIELNRRHLLSSPLRALVPTNHLVAIKWAFIFSLVFEVISLIFSLAESVSISVGKQFEIFSLILLRDSFKVFSHLNEPLAWAEIKQAILSIVTPAVGALFIFIILGFYYKVQYHAPVIKDGQSKTTFILLKKTMALILLISFIAIGLNNFWGYLTKGRPETAFELFFTLLIFSDILIVLISLGYSTRYCVVFRNSGFAVATLLVRLAFIAPVMISALLGVGAALFALWVTIVYNKFALIEGKQFHTFPDI